MKTHKKAYHKEKAAVTTTFCLFIFTKHNCPGLRPGELVFSGANRWVVLP